jgi:hypothetical protein
MKLLIDRQAVTMARRINQDTSADLRTYYLVGDALIVARNGVDLHTIAGQVADCSVGWDTAQPGFAPEEKIGQQRTKITIHRTLANQRYERTLTKQLALSS